MLKMAPTGLTSTFESTAYARLICARVVLPALTAINVASEMA